VLHGGIRRYAFVNTVMSVLVVLKARNLTGRATVSLFVFVAVRDVV
jgi:hypothetical protein